MGLWKRWIQELIARQVLGSQGEHTLSWRDLLGAERPSRPQQRAGALNAEFFEEKSSCSPLSYLLFTVLPGQFLVVHQLAVTSTGEARFFLIYKQEIPMELTFLTVVLVVIDEGE